MSECSNCDGSGYFEVYDGMDSEVPCSVCGGTGVEDEEPVYDDDPFAAPDYCYTCHGRGFIVTCIDDLCHGSGRCIHGDGEIPCPDCDAWEDA